jgi:hypothetical protein
MGLDITAYSHLKALGKHTDADWCEDEEHIQVFAYDSFPQSFRGIPVLETRTVGSGEKFLEGGCYEETDETETIGFRAGSYTGYNRWRADLQAQFNHARESDRPFYELIWFADNEGSIGPEAAADLLADFTEHAERYVPPEYYSPDTYQKWTRAFELAADGGIVRFH